MPENENPIKCERCESDEPAQVYDPRTPGHPHKRVSLCDECAKKDPKVVLVTTAKEGTKIATPKDASELPDTEKVSEMVAAPASNPKRPKASQNKAKDVETKPVDRVDIQNKIAEQEKDIDNLLKSRQEVQQNLFKLNDIIIAKRGAVAGLRDLLGDS
jgi:hypothetical protein